MSEQNPDGKIIFMQRAVELAYENVAANQGGPFGAVIVKDGQIIAEGKNQVTALYDPTAHAEIQAIREACRKLSTFQLTDCVIFTSCEPCPMCLGAIYWARPKAVYYACTKDQACNIGFDDRFIYEEIGLPLEKRNLLMLQLLVPNADRPFQAWQKSPQRIEY